MVQREDEKKKKNKDTNTSNINQASTDGDSVIMTASVVSNPTVALVNTKAEYLLTKQYMKLVIVE